MYASQRPSTPNSPVQLQTTPVADPTVVFDALGDDECRQILEATVEEPMTARELVETHDIPSSSLYRKLETVTEAGLVEERIRIRRNGKHASEYLARTEDLTVSVSAGSGIELEFSAPDAECQKPVVAVER